MGDPPAFAPGAAAFFRELAAHNTRAWFGEHRGEYDREVRAPVDDLYARAEERYGPGRILRPNRDVRFSPDKSPYRIDAGMWAGARVGAVYVSFSAERIEAGGGLYEPTADQLDRARSAIVADGRAARELRAIVAELRGKGLDFAGPFIATAPRGYPRDHPDIELLRMRHFAAVRTLPTDAPTRSITAAWRAVEPLVAWADERVGPAERAR